MQSLCGKPARWPVEVWDSGVTADSYPQQSPRRRGQQYGSGVAPQICTWREGVVQSGSSHVQPHDSEITSSSGPIHQSNLDIQGEITPGLENSTPINPFFQPDLECPPNSTESTCKLIKPRNSHPCLSPANSYDGIANTVTSLHSPSSGVSVSAPMPDGDLLQPFRCHRPHRSLRSKKYWERRKLMKSSIVPSVLGPETSDLRPYADVLVNDVPYRGLLDSGASVSVLGHGSEKLLSNPFV